MSKKMEFLSLPCSNSAEENALPDCINVTLYFEYYKNLDA